MTADARASPGQPVGWHSVGVSRADVGVIGGSGFYEFLEDARGGRVSTPYGDPSAPLAIGTVAGRRWRSCRGTAPATRTRRT